MKRLLCFLLLIGLLPVLAMAEEVVPKGALYRGRMHQNTGLRFEPSRDSGYQVVVQEDDAVYILQYGDEWCYCAYQGSEGWLMTDRIYELWKLSDTPLPGWVPMTGVACILKKGHVAVDGYSGNDLQPGYLISVMNEQGDIPMMRSSTQLEEGSFAYMPFVSAEYAKPGDLLYAFTTWYNNRTGMDKGEVLARGRRKNIALGIERTGNTTIAPGEKFSFNELCGPYTPSNGYVNAPNISVQGIGIGGGVCQISTTIYEALLGLEGLRLDEWRVHRYTGVNYAPRGFDCAVATWKDFAFTNGYDYPVTLEVLAQEGALTALFFRAEE